MRIIRAWLALTLAASIASTASVAHAAPAGKTLSFDGVDFFRRDAASNRLEYTPKGEEDLLTWRSMITLVRYPEATTGDGLAAIANSVLGLYKQNRAMVLKVDAVPAAPGKPAEYFISVVFPTRDFIEAVFTRIALVDGAGAAAIYSHREYGHAVGNEVSAWLAKNGPAKERALRQWNPLPTTGGK
ncbi:MULTISPECIES: hypothetical protein [Burkholderia]|uniref:Lipoprotein n=1 Tax=Burkholderia savannae TaxID=1637837 RepID=A0ABR5TC10_9BURK|nr:MULTISPECIES: hypothetical protein [Burkholderia]AOJ70475.1 hypothetical protein WS78_18100 [Burkholderia savannae]AOJ79255.1 hypothetical protein WS86_00460 [Burkholderia savannae]KGR99219.1 hypothetical protein X946_1087 [Burkholderia sp. ABCPW 111]KVG47397.1 hypothetical protein WS77_04395 [Burkholderia sp. MSMB0265]KVG82349.1 hypothetical protein WS81_00960 [Burkholderia sp. MSMB2040]